MTWHVSQEMMASYRDSASSDAASHSLELHLVECEPCRRIAAGAVESNRRDRIWARISEAVDMPKARWLEEALRRFGVNAHTARLIAMTPSVQPSWLLAVATILALAAVAASSLGPIPFLVVAPLVPVVGVAIAFGHPIDPVHEIGVASPTGGFRLVLIRASAVLMASIAISVVPGLFLREFRWMVVWLLPALACTLLVLVISTFTHLSTAAVVVSLLWVAGVTATELAASTPVASFVGLAQLIFACAVLGLLTLLLLRRTSFERIVGR